jgi:transposase
MSETPHKFECYTGVDIAAKDFTAATMLPHDKPKLYPKPFPQTQAGFQHFCQHLQIHGVTANQHLIVMEATGSYWIALAVALHEAGFVVSVVNPAQAHYFAKA